MVGIIIAVVLGWAGGYQFYKGKFGIGLLYFFTFGLFLVGWIIDISKAVQEYEKEQRRKRTHGTSKKRNIQPKEEVKEPQHETISEQGTKSEPQPEVECETVKITHRNGTIERVTIHNLLSDGNCLVAPLGKAYHTYFGCFKRWPESYRENFDGWTLKRISEAQEMGLRKCRYCVELEEKLLSFMDDYEEESDLDSDLDDDEDGNEDYN